MFEYHVDVYLINVKTKKTIFLYTPNMSFFFFLTTIHADNIALYNTAQILVILPITGALHVFNI